MNTLVFIAQNIGVKRKMNKKAVVLLLAVAGVFLQGCSSAPKSDRGEAIYQALKVDTTLRAWVDACKGVSHKTTKVANLTYQNWWRRNASLVESADYGLSYGVLKVTDTRQAAGAQMAMAITWDVVDSADQDVESELTLATDKEALCLRVLGRYNDGEQDLADMEGVYETLIELEHHKTKQGENVALKRASIEKRTGRVYGRSFYVAEKLSQRYACRGAVVHLLSNAWPYEVYNAECDGGNFVLIRCEWGNCMIVE